MSLILRSYYIHLQWSFKFYFMNALIVTHNFNSKINYYSYLLYFSEAIATFALFVYVAFNSDSTFEKLQLSNHSIVWREKERWNKLEILEANV